jgi:hypothetical protein
MNIIDVLGFAKDLLEEVYFVIVQALLSSKLSAMAEHLKNQHSKKLQGHGENGSIKINDHLNILFDTHLLY